MSLSNIFSGLKVIELANVLAGPSVGAFFSELGATVIKIENRLTGGDVTRRWKLPTESAENNISSYFSSVNWGKFSIGVDLRTEKGLKIIHSLIAKSDIVLASYKPGDAEKLKVDHDTLKRLNPGLIYAHITGYGTRNNRPGYDAIIQAESGFTYMNGEPDSGPVRMPVALMDVLAAHQVKEGILLALLHRERTGEGQYIEVSLIQSGAASLANQASNWLVGETIPQRMGSDHPNIAPYGTIFKTMDGRDIVLAVGTDKQFYELCGLLGIPEIASDERFVSNAERVKHREELKRILQQFIVRILRDDFLEQLNEKNIPAGSVCDMEEVFEQPEVQELLIEATSVQGLALKGLRNAVFVSECESKKIEILPPPHYAEHTEMVLRKFLEFEDEVIQELVDEGVIDAM